MGWIQNTSFHMYLHLCYSHIYYSIQQNTIIIIPLAGNPLSAHTNLASRCPHEVWYTARHWVPSHISRRPAMRVSVLIPVMLMSPRSLLVHGTVSWPVVTAECMQNLGIRWLNYILFTCAYLWTLHTIARTRAQFLNPSSATLSM